jgi:hypothetical protein
MNKAECWFLDTAIRLKIPVNWISATNVDEILNRPHHNLSTPELLVILERMVERGDLFVEYANRDEQRYRTQVPSRGEIESELCRTHDDWMAWSEQVFYGVTTTGGANWEALSHPQWDRFYDEAYVIEPYEGEITAAERGFAEQLLGLVRHNSFVKAIVPESIRWSVLQPWNATYWKQLRSGYRVDFTYLPSDEDAEIPHPAPPGWVHARHRRERKWYTSYLEPKS